MIAQQSWPDARVHGEALVVENWELQDFEARYAAPQGRWTNSVYGDVRSEAMDGKPWLTREHLLEDLASQAEAIVDFERADEQPTEDEDLSQLPILLQLCETTDTNPEDWEAVDGQETGVGVERYFQHKTSLDTYYTCDDQGVFTIQISEEADDENT
jgi:hypothetical protein